jgi:iron complex transport system ATP-binding protein
MQDFFVDDRAPLLEIRNAAILRSGRRILDIDSLRIAQGEHTAILGPNGSGKSSLMKMIAGLHYPLASEEPVVSVFGRSRWDVFELRSHLGIVSSDLHHTFVSDASLHGRDAVLSGFFASQGLFRNHQVTGEMQERASETLRLVEAEHLAAKPLEQMSTGEARRILIARALVSGPRALLLDEPTTGLDLAAARRFLETLRRLAHQGTTILLVTHHVEEVLPEIGRVVLLKDGKVHRDGPKVDVLTSETIASLFDAPVAIARHGDYYAADIMGS